MQLSAIKVNPKNPRLIKDAKADKLMQSLLSFPQMLSLRPIVVDKKGFALGGNMRFLTIERIVALTDAEFQEACAKYAVSPANVRTWQEVRDSKQIPDAWVLKADKLTPEQQREFIIKDNVSGGEWDWDILANEWDVQELVEWGLDLPNLPGEGHEYSSKITAPTYVPRGESPKISELFNDEKANGLIAEIRQAEGIDEDVKRFLTEAAKRHVVFDYENIADFYANAVPDVQRLMEKSALVIIDFDKAVENGFVNLTEEIKELYSDDYEQE